MLKQLLLLPILSLLLSSCASANPAPNTPPLPTEVPVTPSPIATEPLPAEPTGTPVVVNPSLLFFQDFESASEVVVAAIPKWEVIVEEDGNHMLCNRDVENFYTAAFGRDSWTDYAVEARIKSVKHSQVDDAYVSLFVRMESGSDAGYYAAMNFENQLVNLQFSNPYVGYGEQQLSWVTGDEWYLLRVEAAGDIIKFFINNELIVDGYGKQRRNGAASIVSSKGLKICMDDVQVWALDSEGNPLAASPDSSEPDSAFGAFEAVFPAVMANRNPQGLPAYEYKTNCSQNYVELETCFLWDLTDVTTTTPSGKVFHLYKDFNINPFSGEVTRRWVLYGPDGSGYPEDGTYLFSYYKDDQIILEQQLEYTFSIATPVSEIQAVQIGNSLEVDWVPPADMNSDKWYKVYVSQNRKILYSQRFDWNVTHALLPDLNLTAGEVYEIDVDVFSSETSSGGPTFLLEWKSAP